MCSRRPTLITIHSGQHPPKTASYHSPTAVETRAWVERTREEAPSGTLPSLNCDCILEHTYRAGSPLGLVAVRALRDPRSVPAVRLDQRLGRPVERWLQHAARKCMFTYTGAHYHLGPTAGDSQRTVQLRPASLRRQPYASSWSGEPSDKFAREPG